MKHIKYMQFITNQGFRTITYINAILSTNIFQNRADLKANGHIKQVKLFSMRFLFLLKIYYRQLYFLKIMLISSLRCGRVLTLQ